MNILIAGGTGLIGSCFIKQFSSYRFTVLTRFSGKATTYLPASVELISSLDNVQNMDYFDSVINFAG